MVCTHCTSTIDEKYLFCPWCGFQIVRSNEEIALIQAKGPRRAPNADFERARAIYQVWRDNLYFPQYPNLGEYGVSEVGLKKAQVYNYRVIGEKFIDDNGTLRFIGSGDWTIGQVNELKRLTLSQVNSLIANGFIEANMGCSQIREVINKQFPSFHSLKGVSKTKKSP